MPASALGNLEAVALDVGYSPRRMPESSHAFPRAVLFDFDGVIVDSEPMHQKGLAAAVQSMGMRFGDREVDGKWGGTYVGMDDRACFRQICAENGRPFTDEFFEELSARKRDAVQQAFDRGELRPFPGVLELMRACAQRVPIAICSGARRHEIEPLVRHFEIQDIVRTIVSADDVRIAKPDPEGYRLTCARLGVTPAQTMTIEDSPKGIAAARGAGVRVVGVCHSFPAQRLGEADRIVEHVREITAAWIAEWFDSPAS